MALSSRTIKKIGVYFVLGVFLSGTALSAAMYFINPIVNQPEEAIATGQAIVMPVEQPIDANLLETGVVNTTR